MGKIIYFTGGSRSGKSSQAEKYILKKGYQNKIYIATAIPFDNEMKMRVKKHQEQRGESWITIEAYKNLKNKVEETEFEKEECVILLDCLTNMVSNLMIMEKEYNWDQIEEIELKKIESFVEQEVREFLSFAKESKIDLVIVSNELGMGLVPTYPLGRHFRDICGRMNQIAAEYSDEAYFLVSGLEIKLK